MEGRNMKIGEFAAKYGVTDRHARRLAAEHEVDLVGHIEKRGNVGTWIDEYAEAYLRDLLRNPLEILPAEPEKVDPAELQRKLNDATRKWAEAEQRATAGAAAVARLEAAEQRILLLGDVHAEAMNRKEAEHKAEMAGLQAEYSRQIGDLEGANRILTENIEKAGEQIQAKEQQLQDANKRADEADDARKAAEDKLAQIRAKTEELAAAKWWQRGKIARITQELADLQAGKE